MKSETQATSPFWSGHETSRTARNRRALRPWNRSWREIMLHPMNFRQSPLLLAFVLSIPAARAAADEPPADQVLTGGRIWTAEAAQPWADALAIREGRIDYVGSERGALALQGPKTQRLELGGRL